MKAAVYYGPGDMRIEERPVPEPGAGEVLLRVEACAICGTDLRIFAQGQKNVVPPQVIGHEICGRVEALGEGAGGWAEGDRVVVVTPVGCRRCPACREGRPNLCSAFRAMGYHFPGGFAQFMLMPREAVEQGNLIPVPADLPPEEACLIEPLSCAINGQEYLRIEVGDTVAIFGAGPIGMMHLELAKARGATRTIVIDVNAVRLAKVAELFGCDLVVNAQEEDPVEAVLAATGGRGADVVITAAPAKVVCEQALAMCATRGRISYFASVSKADPYIRFDVNTLHYKEISVFGAFASYHAQYARAAQLVASRRVDMRRFVTHQFPLERIEEAFATARGGEGIKVVVRPWG